MSDEKQCEWHATEWSTPGGTSAVGIGPRCELPKGHLEPHRFTVTVAAGSSLSEEEA